MTSALRGISFNPAREDELRYVARVGRGIPWHNRKAVDDVCGRFGDTYCKTSAVGYIKALEELGFEQFADFRMPKEGRTLAFARLSGLVLAMLNICKGHAPHLTCTLRHPILRGGVPHLGFVDHKSAIGTGRLVAARCTFIGNSGLSYKMHLIDISVSLFDRWWSLSEAGKHALPESADNYLMTDLDRKQCSGYAEMVEMQEERRRAVDGYYASVLDTGHTRRYLDVCETVSREQGSLQ